MKRHNTSVDAAYTPRRKSSKVYPRAMSELLRGASLKSKDRHTIMIYVLSDVKNTQYKTQKTIVSMDTENTEEYSFFL